MIGAVFMLGFTLSLVAVASGGQRALHSATAPADDDGSIAFVPPGDFLEAVESSYNKAF